METNGKLPPRSDDTRGEREKKLAPVVKNKVTVRKASPMRTFISRFFASGAADMKEYLIWELLAPGIKTAAQNFIDAWFWGDGKRPDSSSRRGGYVSYNNVSSNKSRNESRRSRLGSSDIVARFGLEEIITETKAEAEGILDAMDATIERYGKVTVGDLFDLINESCEYNAVYYGWTDLSGAYVSRTRGGYLINLPRCVSLR